MKVLQAREGLKQDLQALAQSKPTLGAQVTHGTCRRSFTTTMPRDVEVGAAMQTVLVNMFRDTPSPAKHGALRPARRARTPA
jgi:hypothetical protein